MNQNLKTFIASKYFLLLFIAMEMHRFFKINEVLASSRGIAYKAGFITGCIVVLLLAVKLAWDLFKKQFPKPVSEI